MKKISIISLIIIILLCSCISTPQKRGMTKDGRFIINGRKIFLSGMNLAWLHYGRDLVEFDEQRWIQALDDISRAGGNCIRWWLHVNGSTSPLYDDSGKVLVLNPEAYVSIQRALDLAWDRGIVVIMCLWSFNMLNRQDGVNIRANKLMLEDEEYTMAYINKALRPMVSYFKDHPGIVCWEIFNEPEGMLSTMGWSDRRTDMEYILRFINYSTAAIHREDPDALVTVGSGLQITTDIKGMVNYYSDKFLLRWGGDKQGMLDFYQAHYYPEWEDEATSPFHHPVSYWELDKPVLIGEFPAFGIREFGKGFKPKTSLTTEEAYLYAYENGYAGALSWTWTAHDGFGSVHDAAPGMQALLRKYRDHIIIDTGKNRLPLSMKTVDKLIVDVGTETYEDYINVNGLFRDLEDGENLNYSIGNITKPELLGATIDEQGNVDLEFYPGQSGISYVEIHATDSDGGVGVAPFIVIVYDPKRGNLALFKPVTASSIENKSTDTVFINDGLPDTRWSSAWADNQWISFDLKDVFIIGKFNLNWEFAYGLEYEIQVSLDNETWTTVFHETKGDGQGDTISIEPVKARYVKMNGIKRATQWGFSLWEFEVYAAE